MSRSAILGLCCVILASRPGSSQIPPDTAALDTFPVTRLQSEINWRKLIRVHTAQGLFELARPELRSDGLHYREAKTLERAAEVRSRLDRPLPHAAIGRIEVREGARRGLGAGVGAVVGVASAVMLGSAFEDGQSTLAIVALGSLGALFGVFVGESFYEWRPVYARAAPDPELARPNR